MTELRPCPLCADPMTAGKFADMIQHVSQEGTCPLRGLSFPIEQLAAWNTRAVPRAAGDDGELVERLRYTYEHGIFAAAENGMLAGADEAADRIEALRASNSHWMQEARRLVQGNNEAMETITALRAEVGRLREALAEIEADCEADYPPSHGAIKYACSQALGAKP
jgi:hypothetical protein